MIDHATDEMAATLEETRNVHSKAPYCRVAEEQALNTAAGRKG